MARILVCDDDKEIVEAVAIYLGDEGHTVDKTYNGTEALALLQGTEDVALAIVDLMMPGIDGLQLTAKIRETSRIPIIILSAKSEDGDKIKGLNVGADDYITKPFSPGELKARVNAALRRYTELNGTEENGETDLVRVGGMVIDDRAKTVTVDEKPVRLTPMEYNILLFLASNKGRVFSINEIYENVWKEEAFDADNIVAVHIRHIREKIEINPKEPRYIKVVWGVGYKCEEE